MTNQLKSRLLTAAAVACSIMIITSKPAYAYIDPGTGSYVLQMAVAGVLAAGFVIKSTWKNIKEAFAKRFAKKNGNAE